MLLGVRHVYGNGVREAVRGVRPTADRLSEAMDVRQARRAADRPVRNHRRGRLACGADIRQAEDVRSGVERGVRAAGGERQGAHAHRLPQDDHPARSVRRQLLYTH